MGTIVGGLLRLNPMERLNRRAHVATLGKDPFEDPKPKPWEAVSDEVRATTNSIAKGNTDAIKEDYDRRLSRPRGRLSTQLGLL